MSYRINRFPVRAIKAIALTACLLPAVSAIAQNNVEPAYQGMQPELMTGVQDGMATGRPKIRHVYLAAPDVLAIVVDAQNLWSAPVQKYVPEPGDKITRSNPQNYGKGKQFFWNRFIIRNGVQIGNLVGLKEDHYIPSYELKGEKLDTAWAQDTANYSVSSEGDAAYSTATKPVAVFRKSKPEMSEWTNKGVKEGTARHELYLKLPRSLTPGKKYTVQFATGSPFDAPVTFTFTDAKLRTEAIQVTQTGYHPRQTEKTARLFQWLGSGGGVDFAAFKTFLVVDDKTGATRFTGEIKLIAAGDPARKQAPEKTADIGDTLPAPLYNLDFSGFATPGTYRIVVPGLGTSFPFKIGESVWTDVAKLSAHGFLNQRSGIELGLPYTKYKRPRNFHPADGVPIYQTDPAIFFDPALFPPKGGGNAFKRIQASIQDDKIAPNVWGGWHDAADYDRSLLPQNHTRAVHVMLDLLASNPAYFEKLNLNLPESKNKIPDIADEALWCMDLFLRIQQPDGGVPSAVESIEHPTEPSYLLKQPTAITPPTPETCYVYAAAAAQMSVMLQKYDAKRAAAYRDSALRAMDWAAKNPQVPNIYNGDAGVKEHQNLAHVWMYRLTGDQKWHDAFRASFGEVYPETAKRVGADKILALMAYAPLPEAKADAQMQARCRKLIVATADDKVANTQKWAFGLAPQRYDWDERLGRTTELVAAHRLTGDAKYLLAIERVAQFGLGQNPSNTSYTTGAGSRQVVPFHLDARYLGVRYPEGITTVGPAPRNVWRGSATEKRLDEVGLFPAWENWPWAESNFNIREPVLTEHVVGGNMAAVLLTRAYLAQALEGTK
ncbi:MAG: glycoside hydrolase family 9 protein [Armatimonadetes bacterium]|nr:glycoside hydrolase family 9 protein [Armatimonadota bacterium]